MLRIIRSRLNYGGYRKQPQMNGVSLSSLRCDTTKHFREKKECLKGKMNETERTKIVDICIEAYKNVRRFTNLEITW